MENLSEGSIFSDKGDSALTKRPMVTLSYAQSLDGSIAKVRGSPLSLSCPESLAATHQLRAVHDAVLVGIGTVLADNPHLTVRFTEGKNPRPIVLDSHLRLPLNANLLKNNILPIIAATPDCDTQKRKDLEKAGAVVLCIPADLRGWVDLNDLMRVLKEMEIHRVMVEGGARVITSFLSQHLVDHLILTITPKLLGGLHAVESPLFSHSSDSHNGKLPVLSHFGFQKSGEDIIYKADITWEKK